MSMRPISFDVSLFRGGSEAELGRSRRSLLWLMEALAKCNQEHIATYGAPRLYTSGTIYKPEKGTERWGDIRTILGRGYGDCEDLACYRIAELRHAGIAAKPYITWRNMGPGRKVYHALVQGPTGRIEDPSRALGMGGRRIIGGPVFIEETVNDTTPHR